MTKSEMLALRLQGSSYGQIAHQAGLTRQRVQQLLTPPKEIRNYVQSRAQDRCESCHVVVARGHIHHVACKGLEEESYQDIENLQYLCPRCHWEAHDFTQPPAKEAVNVQLRVPPALYKQLKAMAEQEAHGQRPSMNRVALNILEEYFENTQHAT